MKMHSRIVTTLAAGALALALAVPSFADDNSRGWGPGWGMGRMMGDWGMMGGPWMGYGPDAMLDRMDGRLAFLKAELKITDAQKAAWDDMALAVRAMAESHNDQMKAMMEQMHDRDYFKMPLPDRLQFQETHMEGMLEQLKAVRESVDKLYATLDDNQKKQADEIMLPMMGMGMGPGMGGMWGGGFGPGRGGMMRN